MKGARLLVVDDDAGMLRAVERVLSQQHEVLACRSPLEALALAPSFRPEVALLDVRMQEMSGFELLEALRRAWPDLDVILMTGSVHSFDTHLVQAIRVSAYYFLEKPFDREVLQTLVERCVQVRRLREENRRHTQRMERDLRLARTFQHSLLPGEPLVHGGCRLAGRYMPCAELGGDLYDYAACDGDYVGFVVADVTGHGVGAAMVTGIVKAAFRECAEQQLAPLAVVRRMLAHLRALSSQRFLTMFCGRVSCARRVLEYVSAGHPPAVYRGRDGVKLLESTGTLVSAVLEEQAWEMASLRHEAGGALLVYTDGLPDAHGTGEPLGLARVVRAVQGSAGGGEDLLDDMQRLVGAHVGSHELTDDVALLSVSYE